MEITPLLAVPIIDPDPVVPSTEVRSTGRGSEQLMPRATDVPVPVKVEPDWTMSVVRSNEYVHVTPSPLSTSVMPSPLPTRPTQCPVSVVDPPGDVPVDGVELPGVEPVPPD